MCPPIQETLASLSAPLPSEAGDLSIILAAGHGKRIKSSRSKMLHAIWGKPSVVRIVEACQAGLHDPGQIVVVGIMAEEVARTVSEHAPVAFAYQAEQNGTGHAVACALERFDGRPLPGNVYVFPGDMGLLHGQAVADLRAAFDGSPYDMMVMTGVYDGPAEENYYGRILRVPERDETGAPAGDDEGNVLEIKEHKDILALQDDYRVPYKGRAYRFTRQDLLSIREFNTSVYAFRGELLRRFIGALKTDNIQGEVYLTDLIGVFNQNGLSIGATSPEDGTVVLGFNNKSVLRKMEDLARQRVYDRLKDIITFEAPEDFFIADEVADDLVRMDREKGNLDIVIGKGARIERGVSLNINVQIGHYACLSGAITLGRNVSIGANVEMSVYRGQRMEIEDDAEILHGDIIKGPVTIGRGARIETPVTITGSDEFPTRIGAGALIKGTTYIFGSTIDDDVTIEHCVLKCKRIERIERKDGSVQAVRYYLPLPQGIDCVSDMK